MELVFVAICLFLVFGLLWYGFGPITKSQNKTNTYAGYGLEMSPEWHALVAIRDEIETDPQLDEELRQLHLKNWKNMAEEIRIKSEASVITSDAAFNNLTNRVNPKWWLMLVLTLALLVTYSIGGFHEGSFTFPKPPVSAGPTAEQALAKQTGHPGDGGSLQARVASLQEKLAQNPSDPNGWVLLARTQAALSDYLGSATSLKRALALVPDHPQLMADLADMLAMANDRRLQGEPFQWISRVLEVDPTNEKGLALAATAAEQSGDNEGAAKLWAKLRDLQKQALANGSASPATVSSEPSPAKASMATKLVSTTVVLPVGWSDPTGQSVLFIFVKEAPQAGRPLAAVRVAIDSRLSYVADITEANFIGGAPSVLPPNLYVQARVAVSGTPSPDPRDLVSDWLPVSTNNLPAELAITLKAQ